MLTVLPANGAADTGYSIDRSLRLRASASAYLNRTGAASPTDYRKFTFSFWMKRGALSTAQRIIDSTSAGLTGVIALTASDELAFGTISGGAYTGYLQTSNLLRDPSAWYHIVFSCDTSVASNQFKFYVNGVEASYSTNSSTLLNYGVGINGGSEAFLIGRSTVYGLNFDGYFAEFNFIDGQALTPASFGETDSTTGVWKPKRYTGTYGTNGFYLNFEDNSGATATTIGKDSSGNGNNWTPNNISVTAGVTYDSMTDVPTLTDDRAANYCVLNPLSTTAGAYSNGNLRYAGPSSWRRSNGTLAVSTGKWYWEVTLLNSPYSPRASDTAYNAMGFGLSSVFNSTAASTTVSDAVILGDNGFVKNFTGSNFDTGGTFSSGNVLAAAVDLNANTFTFYRNNSVVASGTIGGTAGRELVPILLSYDGSIGAMDANFGQRPFAYTPPTGFVALNAYNLPDATIKKGSDNFNVVLDTGANIKTTTEALYPSNFFEWIKDRANANNHQLIDIVRGATAVLQSNTSAAETTYSAPSGNSVGFAWKAGGAAVSNTAGSITSQVSANASAGNSIVTYTGNGTSGATVGHGLGVAPKMIIIKARSSGVSWIVWHSALGANNYLILNSTNAVTSTVNFGSVTSTTFNLNGGSGFNGSGTTYVAYCFAEIDGFSKFGSISANSSADNSLAYTGFLPRFVMLKRTDSTSNWIIWDTARNTFNVMGNDLYPNLSNAEASTVSLDILSNGFKLRSSGFGGTWIYAAFAENPFKNSLAR